MGTELVNWCKWDTDLSLQLSLSQKQKKRTWRKLYICKCLVNHMKNINRPKTIRKLCRIRIPAQTCPDVKAWDKPLSKTAAFIVGFIQSWLSMHKYVNKEKVNPGECTAWNVRL